MAHVVRVDDERGAVVRRLGVTAALDRRWTEDDQVRFPWLSSIDPYGDTTFNHRQLRHVQRELASLRSQLNDSNDIEEIDKLIQWIDEVPDRHVYLRLVGD